LYLPAGWQTLVFCLHGDQRDRHDMSVHLSPARVAWRGDAPVNTAVETALAALRHGRPVFRRDVVDVWLQATSVLNPMIGILAAHALRLEADPDHETYDAIVDRLRELIPDHPDVVALAMWRGGAVDPRDLAIAWPPMLVASYRDLVLPADLVSPTAIVTGSLAERIAGSLLRHGLWLAWSRLADDVEPDRPEMRQALYTILLQAHLLNTNSEPTHINTWDIATMIGLPATPQAYRRVAGFLDQVADFEQRTVAEVALRWHAVDVAQATGVPTRTVRAVLDHVSGAWTATEDAVVVEDPRPVSPHLAVDAQTAEIHDSLLRLARSLPSERKDRARLLDTIARLHDLGISGGRWRHEYATIAHARVQLSLYRLNGDRSALIDAMATLEGAERLARQPGDLSWSSAASALAVAYRLGEQYDTSRTWGLRALRGSVWACELRSGTARFDGAYEAADTGIALARWCLADGRVREAAMALETARSTLVRASTTPDLRERLHPPRLPDTPDDPTGEAAILAHARSTSLDGLVDDPLPERLGPPTINEIRAALRRRRADALVYLIPADQWGPGGAVIIPRHGEPAYLPLSQLGTEPGGIVDRHSRALAAYDACRAGGAGPSVTALRTTWREALDELCTWAWSTTIAPLLASPHVPDRGPSLVLVPIGALATVPWHAAHDPQGGYAVQRAVFSYAASARLLCDSAVWRPATDNRGGLIVGDRFDDATTLQDTFFPDAVLLDPLAGLDGRPSATADSVLRWLRSPGTGHGVLHLSAHGVVEPDGHGSYLQLADGERLTTQQITRQFRASPIRLVVLNACSTATSTGVYDEASSLPTAFHVAGAKTVLGTLWPVPETAEAVLSFMAYHFLQNGRTPAAEALRDAQLWMLDPQRRPPAEMPNHLTARISGMDLADIATWAGVTHSGA
jgi:hypothetical protein